MGDSSNRLTDRDLQFIADNYLELTGCELARRLKRSRTSISTGLKKLGLVVPPEIRKKRQKDASFKKGMIPHNKGKKMSPHTPEALARMYPTMFKPGHIPVQSSKPLTQAQLKGRHQRNLRKLRDQGLIPEVVKVRQSPEVQKELRAERQRKRREKAKIERLKNPKPIKVKVPAIKEVKSKAIRTAAPKMQILKVRKPKKKEVKPEKPKFETINQDMSKLIPKKLDHRTTIYIRPDKNIDKVINKYTQHLRKL